MELVCGQLGLRRAPVRYGGEDFNGIFDGLRSRTYDAVISGTTITAEREKVALFCDPYLESGQSLAVNVARTPHVTSVDDLTGLVVGIQIGDTTPTPSPAISSNAARSPASATTPTAASAMRWKTSPPGGSVGSSSCCRC